MGIRISAEDGALDSRGNVAGHGVDPTGNVADIRELANKVFINWNIRFTIIILCLIY